MVLVHLVIKKTSSENFKIKKTIKTMHMFLYVLFYLMLINNKEGFEEVPVLYEEVYDGC